MAVDVTIICVSVLVATALVRRIEDRRELQRHTITPEELRVATPEELRVALASDVKP